MPRFSWSLLSLTILWLWDPGDWPCSLQVTDLSCPLYHPRAPRSLAAEPTLKLVHSIWVLHRDMLLHPGLGHIPLLIPEARFGAHPAARAGPTAGAHPRAWVWGWFLRGSGQPWAFSIPGSLAGHPEAVHGPVPAAATQSTSLCSLFCWARAPRAPHKAQHGPRMMQPLPSQ